MIWKSPKEQPDCRYDKRVIGIIPNNNTYYQLTFYVYPDEIVESNRDTYFRDNWKRVVRWAYEKDLVAAVMGKLNTTPITEEWAATVRAAHLTLHPVDHPTQGEGWLFEGTDHESNGLFRVFVQTQGAVMQILNAMQPQKEGA